MTLANLRDRAVVEWDALEVELQSYGQVAYDAAMRELGHTGMIVKRSGDSKGGAEQHRCEWEGGYCSVFASGRYCSEHSLENRPALASAYRRAA